MADTIVLLGMEQTAGAGIVKALAAAGLEPLAEDWPTFSCRSYGRNRPGAIMVDIDNPSARAMDEFSGAVRKAWGEGYPIIAVAASKKFSDISSILDAGASDYLPKAAPSGLIEKKLTRHLKSAQAAQTGGGLAEELPEPLLSLFSHNDRLVRLGDIADIHAGATPRMSSYRRMAPPDNRWRGVVTSDAVDRFLVGRPAGYLLWTRRHLFRLPHPDEYDVPEKVFLSRSGPPLRAAVDRSRTPAGTDVYSIVPREGVGAGFIACILNSRVMDFYYNRFGGASDGRIRQDAVRATPFPRPTSAAVQELTRHGALMSHFGPNPESWIDRQSRDEIREQMDEAVLRLYGAGREAREGLAALHF